MKIFNNKYYFIKQTVDILDNEKKKLPLLFAQFFLVSFLELLGLAIIAPFIQMILNPNVETVFFIKWFEPFFNTNNHASKIYLSGSLLLLIFVVKDISIVFINKNIAKFSQFQQVRLRNKLMKTYQGLPYSEFLKRNSAEYIQTTMMNVARYIAVLQLSLKISTESITLTGIIVFLLIKHTSALLLLLLLLGGFGLLYILKFKNHLFHVGLIQTETGESMMKSINESMDGFKEIRVLGTENYFFNKFSKACEKNAKANISREIIRMVPRYFLETLIITFIVLLSFIIVNNNSQNQQFVSVLGVFGVAAIRMIPLTNVLISGFVDMQTHIHPVKRLWQDLQFMPKIKLNAEIKSPHSYDSPNGKEFFQRLQLKNVSFRYIKDGELVLRDINLKINNGEVIGLIGTSGVGKTTLIDTLMGLLKPIKGEILLDGKSLTGNVLDNWRSQIAYLPQQIFLIDDSLKNNVALGIEDKNVDIDKVEQALDKARLTPFLNELPNDINTLIGERGIRLSGGQRQRVALARAFYHDRDVLIMDEATSSLDNETEKEIISEIEQLKGQKTMIVIAHRLTTVEHCNRILRLDNGQIIEN